MATLEEIPLSEIQPLPTATRRKLVEEMSAFSPPANWRDDDTFYTWLLGHYDGHGTDHVDEALTAMGGKDARRRLVQTGGAWLSRQETRFRSIKDAILARDMDAHMVPVVEWFRDVLAIDSEEYDTPDEAAVPEHEDVIDHDSTPAAIEAAREALTRLEARPDPELLDLVAEFTQTLIATLDQLDGAAEREREMLREMEVEAARDALARELESLPRNQFDELPTQVRSRDIALLEDAAGAVAALRAAIDDLGEAMALNARQGRTMAEIEADFDRYTAAYAAMKAAHADATGALALVQDAEAEIYEVKAIEEASVMPEPIADCLIDAIEPVTVGAEAAHENNGVEADGEVVEEAPETEPVEPAGIAMDVEPAADLGAAEVDAEVEVDAEDDGPPARLQQPLDEWDRWTEMALESGRIGLAAHLARAREQAGADTPDSWRAAVLTGLVRGRSVKAGNDLSASRYEELSPQLLEAAGALSLDHAAGLGQALTVLAGALRPCLVANYVGVQVIDALPTGRQLTEFHALVELLRDGPQLGLDAVDDLRPLPEDSERERLGHDAVTDLKAWFYTARTRKMAGYVTATALWQNEMIRPDGVVGSVFTAAIAGTKDAVERAQALVEELRGDIDDFLDGHFKTFQRGKGRELEGMARGRFITLLQEARDHLEAWLRVARPVGNRTDRFVRPRGNFKVAVAQARRCAQEFVREGALPVRLGAALLESVLDQFNDVLNGTDSVLADSQQVLDTEIALLPDFPLNGRVGLEIAGSDTVALRDAAERNLADGMPTWSAAFDRAIMIGAPGVAQRLMPMLPPDQTEARYRIDGVIEDQRRKVNERREQLRILLDDLLSATVDGSTAYEAQLLELEQFDLTSLPVEGLDDAGAIGDFPVLVERLDAFEQDLSAARAEVAAELEVRIKALAAEGADLSDCCAMLDRGSLGTLAEELAQIADTGTVQRPDNPSALLQPVEHFARAILARGPEGPGSILLPLGEAATSGVCWGAFAFDALPASERIEARQLIDSWRKLQQVTQSQPSARSAALIHLLEAIGFGNVRVASEAAWRTGRRFEVKVDPLRSAGDCIIPAFGSQAEGSYTVLVMPKGSLEKSVPSGFDDLPARTIVLAMEWLTPKARTQFLRKARGRSDAAFALLDDPGIGALAATPGRNLRSFFTLAVPFGAGRPYSDTSAKTSVEMFFGRVKEYDTLFAPEGSCLVYGGRQLGKTALLKQIEQRNQTNRDTVVVYSDIKNVGSVDMPTAVWARIGEALHKKNPAVFAEGLHGDKVADSIEAWLRGQGQRRVLILLDEADNFLESEMEADFPNIMKMKGLMETHGRRVKFVYAGLHNVQRFVRAPNSPMLHLGEPVKIGPLMGHDRHAARQMVFEPMAAAGVGFTQPTDAHHMLSLVGYYPSLLQTFGKSLLARIDEGLALKGEPEQMPALLDRAAIEQGFKASAFREDLQRKFRATLELDPRYELIAYVVCQMTEDERARGRLAAHGFRNDQILEVAREYWPQGFEDIRSSDTFSALLDEMVGLGVFAQHGEHYAIRSARIATMLGNRDQIETKLLEFAPRGRPTKPDPMANHRELPSGAYSPWSWRDENTLVDQLRSPKHPVALLCITGSMALADMTTIVATLKDMAELQQWPSARELEYRTIDDLLKVIPSARSEAATNRPKLIICHGRWPTQDDIARLDGLRELRDAAAPVRVVFVGDAHDQVFGRVSLDACRNLKARWVDIVPWQREAIALWLHRHARPLADDAAFVERVRAVTGGFSTVFHAIAPTRAPITDGDDMLARLKTAAAKALTPSTIGVDNAGMRRLIERLIDFDDPEGLDEEYLQDLAAECEDATHALPGLRTMGLLEEVQASGPPCWRLLEAVRTMATGA